MLSLFKRYYPVRKAIFVTGEGLFILLAVFLSSWMLFGSSFIVNEQTLLLKAILITIVCQMCLYYNDLYNLRITYFYSEFVIRLLQSLGASSILLALLYYAFPVFIIGRWIFNVSVLIVIVLLFIWRLGYLYIVKRGILEKKIILLGNGDLANKIAYEVIDNPDCGYAIVKKLHGKEYQKLTLNDSPLGCSIGLDDLCADPESHKVTSIVVAIEEKRKGFPLGFLLECRVKGIEVLEGSSFYEMLTGKLLVDKINPSWLIFSEGFKKSWLRRLLKRTVDILASMMLLLLLSPILLLVAVLIKLDSNGPVFYSQNRVGEGRKEYMVHKFRSMVQDAEKKSGPVWAQKDDARVTRVGHFIRKWRIDEFPQLFNVIRGEMSFVGPRPERAFFVKDLETAIPYYGERFSVKPGVTGWAQVNYPYGDTVEDAKEKLNYDLFYIKNMNIFMDLMVIMKTVKTVLFGEGAR